jgi:hypothetical protein
MSVVLVMAGVDWRLTMLAYTVPQMVFFFMVAAVAVMVLTIVARMLRT